MSDDNEEGVGLPPSDLPAEEPTPNPDAAGPPPPPPSGSTPRIGLPWERADGRSLGSALETIRLVLLAPAEGFAMMRRSGTLGPPLLYLVVFGTVGAFFALLWQNTFRSLFGRLADASDLAQIAAVNSFGVIQLLMAPVFVLLFTSLSAIVIHVALMAFGGAPRPLDTTLRTLCYATGSTYLFSILPFCGNIISFFWWLVVLSIGIREAQEVPGGRAVAAVLAPIILVCCCCAALSVTFGAAILSIAEGF